MKYIGWELELGEEKISKTRKNSCGEGEFVDQPEAARVWLSHFNGSPKSIQIMVYKWLVDLVGWRFGNSVSFQSDESEDGIFGFALLNNWRGYTFSEKDEGKGLFLTMASSHSPSLESLLECHRNQCEGNEVKSIYICQVKIVPNGCHFLCVR
jgi:hypothetical protein